MEYQICNRCFVRKPLTEEFFYRHITSKNGFLKQCNVCVSAATKKYREENSEVVLLRKKNYWLEANFKRTPEWYQQTILEQGGHCALCETRPIGEKRFQIDHDHACCPTDKTHRKTCGKCVRGLLCEGCNSALGHLETFLSEITGTVVPKEGTWTSLALQYLTQYATER